MYLFLSLSISMWHNMNTRTRTRSRLALIWVGVKMFWQGYPNKKYFGFASVCSFVYYCSCIVVFYAGVHIFPLRWFASKWQLEVNSFARACWASVVYHIALSENNKDSSNSPSHSQSVSVFLLPHIAFHLTTHSGRCMHVCVSVFCIHNGLCVWQRDHSAKKMMTMIMAQLTMAEDDVITNKNVETRAAERERAKQQQQ